MTRPLALALALALAGCFDPVAPDAPSVSDPCGGVYLQIADRPPWCA